MTHAATSGSLVVGLEGGLGNQLFQFATAYALVRESDYRLVLDARIGFWLDRHYRRKFLLDRLTKHYDLANWSQSSLVLAQRIRRKLVGTPPLYSHIGSTLVISETHEEFIPNLWRSNDGHDVIIQGYWQAPMYFRKYSSELRSILKPPVPTMSSTRDLGNKIHGQETVAVGIRMYEESPDPEFHARQRQIKTPDDYSQALARLADEKSLDHIYVFVTHPFGFLDDIKWPCPKTVVSHETGINDPVERLWLMTKAHNFLFNNSTFYWWGAWLADYVSSERSIVLASDNFRNFDIYEPGWWTF